LHLSRGLKITILGIAIMLIAGTIQEVSVLTKIWYNGYLIYGAITSIFIGAIIMVVGCIKRMNEHAITKPVKA
jgi:hypothetical protein